MVLILPPQNARVQATLTREHPVSLAGSQLLLAGLYARQCREEASKTRRPAQGGLKGCAWLLPAKPLISSHPARLSGGCEGGTRTQPASPQWCLLRVDAEAMAAMDTEQEAWSWLALGDAGVWASKSKQGLATRSGLGRA